MNPVLDSVAGMSYFSVAATYFHILFLLLYCFPTDLEIHVQSQKRGEIEPLNQKVDKNAILLSAECRTIDRDSSELTKRTDTHSAIGLILKPLCLKIKNSALLTLALEIRVAEEKLKMLSENNSRDSGGICG